jgi:hypothetical protein
MFIHVGTLEELDGRLSSYNSCAICVAFLEQLAKDAALFWLKTKFSLGGAYVEHSN